MTRPTVNLYLWDVRQNLEKRAAGMEVVDGEDGRQYRRPPLPRVDCRYLITAWTADVGDEHALLGSLLATLLVHAQVPEEYLRGAYAPVRPVPTIEVAAADGKDQSDLWSALGGQLKPGLDLLVTATVDAAVMVAMGSPVEHRQVDIEDLRSTRQR